MNNTQYVLQIRIMYCSRVIKDTDSVLTTQANAAVQSCLFCQVIPLSWASQKPQLLPELLPDQHAPLHITPHTFLPEAI